MAHVRDADASVCAASEVLAIGDWRTNGELIRDVAALGYLEGTVLDLTYGKGAFWSAWRPEHLVTNDLNPDRETHFKQDFRKTDVASDSFDVVVFDPPYKLAGTPASGEMDQRYGTEVVRTRGEMLSLLVSGIAEAMRVARGHVLVKVQDQVNGGKVRWLTNVATDTARALEWRQIDEFHLRGGRPQPEGRGQVHARRNYSTLLVFGPR